MPEMSGTSLAAQLKNTRSKVNVVLLPVHSTFLRLSSHLWTLCE
jgi:FixJ family two-component response regulator